MIAQTGVTTRKQASPPLPTATLLCGRTPGICRDTYMIPRTPLRRSCRSAIVVVVYDVVNIRHTCLHSALLSDSSTRHITAVCLWWCCGLHVLSFAVVHNAS